ARPRLCVRLAASLDVFPSTDGLPSPASAGGAGPPLFDGFSGTMPSSDFPTPCVRDVWLAAFSGRPVLPSGGVRVSRFPCEEFPRMRRVSDCAGPRAGSPVAPVMVWPSASLNSVGAPEDLISQLDGWPACAPVNASAEALRPLPHDSGSGWLAGPSRYDSCIRYS